MSENLIRLTYLEDDAYNIRQMEEFVEMYELPVQVKSFELLFDAIDHLPDTDVLVLDAIGVLGGMFTVDDKEIEAMFLHIREHFSGPIIVYSGLPQMVEWVGDDDDNFYTATKGSHGFSDVLALVDAVVNKEPQVEA